jgi:hypothetical protein
VQTLRLSESTPRTESRLKMLFWPSIQNAGDVDDLGVQGYWICSLVALGSFILLALEGHGIVAAIVFMFYYLGGSE